MVLLHSCLVHSASSGWDTAKQEKEQDQCSLAGVIQRLIMLARDNWTCCCAQLLRQGLRQPLAVAGQVLARGLAEVLWLQPAGPPGILVVTANLCSANTHHSSLAAASTLPR